MHISQSVPYRIIEYTNAEYKFSQHEADSSDIPPNREKYAQDCEMGYS